MLSVSSGVGDRGADVGSRADPEYFIGVHSWSAIESIARSTAMFLAITTERLVFHADR